MNGDQLLQEAPGFETILAAPLTVEAVSAAVEENYCPDCYDCDVNCEECDNTD